MPSTITQTPLTVQEVFRGAQVIDAWASWDLKPLIVRGHHTDRAELDRMLAEMADFEGSELQQVIPGAHTTTWVRFTAHQDWCPAVDPDDEVREECEDCRSRQGPLCEDCRSIVCECGDEYAREQLFIHPATAETAGAVAVTWLWPYLAEWTPDYSCPENYEPYVANLRARGWFDNPVEGPCAATSCGDSAY